MLESFTAHCLITGFLQARLNQKSRSLGDGPLKPRALQFSGFGVWGSVLQLV